MSPITNVAAPITQNLQSINLQPRKLEQAGGATGLQQAEAGSSQNFGKVLNKFVTEVDSKMQASSQERNKVLTGETTNLHQAMIASQEANISFTFMVEMRNKLVESYQELMRSQI